MSEHFTPPHGLGRRPDRPDRRDRALYATVPNVDTLPDRVDNEALLPGVFDQGAIGSCVGWSSAQVAYTVMKRDGHRAPFMPSPVFLYREARVLGGYVEEDAGAEIRNAWKAMNKLGLARMSSLKPRYEPRDMPDESTFLFPEKSIWRKPASKSVYDQAETRQMIGYHKLFLLADLLQCLAEGRCANIGFTVFRSFYGERGPLLDIPDPRPGERELGGHAVVAYGYDKPRRRVLCRNQWALAHQGTPNFTLSFNFMQGHSDDWWGGLMAEGGKAPVG